MNYDNIKLSLKASSVPLTIKTYDKISQLVDYPLHLGVTDLVLLGEEPLNLLLELEHYFPWVLEILLEYL